MIPVPHHSIGSGLKKFSDMKRILLLVSVIFLTTCLYAQDAEAKKVQKAVDDLYAAMVDADSVTMNKFVASKLLYVHSSGDMDDKPAFIRRIMSGRSDFVSVKLESEPISISGNTAIVRHILRAETNDNGKPGSVQLRIMQVWQKQEGKWKLLARSASRIQ